MKITNYARAKELFLEACELDPPTRAAFLARACAGDAELRTEVESLLEFHEPEATEPAAGDVTIATRAPSDAATMAAPSPTDAATIASSGAPIDSFTSDLPENVGAYRVVRELGRGGMGVVYLGVQETGNIKRHVAIKMLKKGMDTDEVLRRFQIERQVLASLNHNGIGRLYDAGETDEGLPYFVMEYVVGQELEAYCDTHRLHIRERLELFQRICEAVHYAHQNLVVHRDLKPGNIIVTETGDPKLLDFGIAKLINPDASFGAGVTAADVRVMTPEYASPEQVRGNPLTTATDIYSLGVLLYELVSGHAPYTIESRVATELERIICDTDPDRPSTAISRIERGTAAFSGDITPASVGRNREIRPDRLRKTLSGDIDNIVMMAMRKEPQRRYRSAEQLGEDIQRHLDGLPVIACADTLSYRMSKFVRRNRGGVAAAAAIVLALTLGLTGTALGWTRAEAAKQAAIEAREETQVEKERVTGLKNQMDNLLTANFSTVHAFLTSFDATFSELKGSITARHILSTTALANLEQMRDEVGDDPRLLREIALGYSKVGDIQGGIRTPSRGDTEVALSNYMTAFDMRSELLAADPENPGLQRDLLLSHTNIGDMLMRMGDVTGGRDHYEEALALAEILKDDTPSGAQSRRDLARAITNVGAARVATGENEAALELYERSHAIRRRLLAENPTDAQLQRDLAVSTLRIAGRLANAGEDEAALAHYRESLEIRERLLAAEPHNARYVRDVSTGRYFVGKGLLALNDPDAALAALDGHVAYARQRADDNPRSGRAQRDLAIAYEIVGHAHLMAGDLDTARTHFDEFQDVIVVTARSDPNDDQFAYLEATSYARLAEVARRSDDLDTAMALLQKARRIYQKLTRKDPDNARRRRDAAWNAITIGTTLIDAGRAEEAETWILDAAEVIDADLAQSPADITLRELRGRAFQQLARIDLARNDGPAALAKAQQSVIVTVPTSRSLETLAAAQAATGDLEAAARSIDEAKTLLDDEWPGDIPTLRESLEEILSPSR